MAEQNLEDAAAAAPPPGPLGLNPMLINLIIDNMFGYCDFEDLASCRLVSTLWFKTSLPHWLEKGPQLKLDLNPTPTNHHQNENQSVSSSSSSNNDDNGGWKDMVTFLQQVHNGFHSYEPYEFAGLRQYKKFEVRGDDLQVAIQHQLLQQFLSKCGGSLTDLKLSLQQIPDVDTYRAVMLSKMSPSLVKMDADVSFVAANFFRDDDDGTPRWDFDEVGRPEEEAVRHNKLTSLQIDFRFGTHDEFRSFPAQGWIQLLRRYPNLKTLLHGVTASASNQAANRMLKAIWKLRQSDKKILDLKRLEFRHVIPGDEDGDHANDNYNCLVPFFRESQLTLETLRFSLGELTPAQLNKVLELQTGSLKKLTIEGGSLSVANSQPPTMESVETLELIGHPFQNLVALNSFPSLKSLIITFPRDNVLSSFGLQFMLRGTLENQLSSATLLSTFRCDSGSHSVLLSQEDIRKLQLVMPNLEHLHLYLNNETFRQVCQGWPRLRRLTVLGKEVDDEGITGVVHREAIIQPNITRLQDLESLTMKHFDTDYVDNVGPTAITENSLELIWTLPKLKELVTTLDRQVVVNPDMVSAMKQEIKTFHLTWARSKYDVVDLLDSSSDDDDDVVGEDDKDEDSDWIDSGSDADSDDSD